MVCNVLFVILIDNMINIVVIGVEFGGNWNLNIMISCVIIVKMLYFSVLVVFNFNNIVRIMIMIFMINNNMEEFFNLCWIIFILIFYYFNM